MRVVLDRRIHIDKRVLTQDAAYGSSISSWELLAKVWAEVRDELPSRSESLRQGMQTRRLPTRIRIRFREDVDSTMRVRYGDRVLQIVGGPAELGRRQYLELLCDELTPDGAGS